MLDIKYIRDNAEAVQKAAQEKNLTISIKGLLAVDKERSALMQEIEALQAQKNVLNDRMKKATADERPAIIVEGKVVKEQSEQKEPVLQKLQKEFDALMVQVPTVHANDVPRGKDESENVVVYEKGEKPQFDFVPKDHITLGRDLDIIDFERGAKVAGYRGYYLKGDGAALTMALMMYALHKIISKGFTPMIPPTLVKEFALFGSGYFKGTEYDQEIDEIYQVASKSKTADGADAKEKKFLVGTAEPSLLAYYADEVLDESQLPMKLCGYSQCYRSEIGSYGKDTKGMYRVHEFMKIEQVVLAPADVDLTEKIQQEMVAISEEIHQELGLPYRKLAICTGDMSAGKYRMFDLEAWMPGMDRWGETASASNFLDWQSRRLNVRYKDKDGKKKYVYMLNNTVLPSPRPFIAVLENYQQADGSVIVPEVLRSYMPGGKNVITK
ncbi:MAG: serine--tRNA ligase [Parcubacteria group bacterium]|jgi:seryl-tRNA synthetase